MEFTSERKRSSVVIRHPQTGQIILYCKGADDVILERIAANSEYGPETREHLHQFASDGLRTLCLAYRVINEEFFQSWLQRFAEASSAIIGREQLLDNVANEIEIDLLLIGATAIEDKLQVGVPDAIAALLRAGIKVWIITGDKEETAVNIGYACKVLTHSMRVVRISVQHEIEEKLQEAREISADVKIGLVVSGQPLSILLSETHIDDFLELAVRCGSVICCRVSPLQKAKIVEEIRSKTQALTLAIGDGANDVGMLLKADVGVGISGKEGRQAVLASDYSFTQFRFLIRLLFFHGQLNFQKNVDLINYSFYKNIALSLNQMVFGIFSGFSGNTLYDSILYIIYNVVFTSVPIVIFAAFERDVSETSLMRVPELYQFDGQRKYYQGYLRFWLAILLGAVHALIAFFVCYLGLAPYLYADGRTIGLSDFGTAIYMCVVTIVNIRVACMCHYWIWLHHVFIWASILILPVVGIIVDAMKVSLNFTGTIVRLIVSPPFYFSLLASVACALVPIVAMEGYSGSKQSYRNEVRRSEKIS
jgi:phospholipid-translocating P-type ATPase (flippase)